MVGIVISTVAAVVMVGCLVAQIALDIHFWHSSHKRG